MRWLGILSQHSEKWPDDIEKCRSRYDDLRAVHLIDDKRNNHNLDPSFNNPLSQDTESPWNQFFIDSELKKVIEKVSETFQQNIKIRGEFLMTYFLGRCENLHG